MPQGTWSQRRLGSREMITKPCFYSATWKYNSLLEMHIELSKSCIWNGNIWQQSLQFHEKKRAIGFEMELWEDHTGNRVWLTTLQNTFSATFLRASEKDEKLFHKLFCGAESCILPRRNTCLTSLWHIFTPWKPWNETMLKFDNKSLFNDPWLSLLSCKSIKIFSTSLHLDKEW